MIRTMSILAAAALGALLTVGPTTTSMAAQAHTGGASPAYIGNGGGHGGPDGRFGDGFGDGGHGFSDHGLSGDYGGNHFRDDHGVAGARDFRGDFWLGESSCYPAHYYYSYDPYFCG